MRGTHAEPTKLLLHCSMAKTYTLYSFIHSVAGLKAISCPALLSVHKFKHTTEKYTHKSSSGGHASYNNLR